MIRREQPVAYEEKYIDWQRKVDPFGGMTNSFKFAVYLRKEGRLLGFGCGGRRI